MKAKSLTTIVALAFTFGAHAQSPSETTNVIAAQSNITKSHIESILMSIGKKGENTKFSVRDYLAQTDGFKTKVDQAMTVFQNDLEKEILPKVAFWIEQYNAVHSSTEFSDNQKSKILLQRYEALKNQFTVLSKEYQSKLSTLYKVVPNAGLKLSGRFNKASEVFNDNSSYDSEAEFTLLLGTKPLLKTVAVFDHAAGDEGRYGRNTLSLGKVKATFFGKSSFMGSNYKRRKIFADKLTRTLDYAALSKELFDCLEQESNCTYRSGDDEKELFKITDQYSKFAYDQAIFKSFKGTCQSMLCLSLRASDYATLLASIDTLIDEDIEFTLADGRRISLEALNQNNTYLLNQLARTDYPVNLPFEN